jgi:hypothetical protein
MPTSRLAGILTWAWASSLLVYLLVPYCVPPSWGHLYVGCTFFFPPALQQPLSLLPQFSLLFLSLLSIPAPPFLALFPCPHLCALHRPFACFSLLVCVLAHWFSPSLRCIIAAASSRILITPARVRGCAAPASTHLSHPICQPLGARLPPPVPHCRTAGAQCIAPAPSIGGPPPGEIKPPAPAPPVLLTESSALGKDAHPGLRPLLRFSIRVRFSGNPARGRGEYAAPSWAAPLGWGWREAVSRLGMVGPRGSRVVSPLGNCDSGGGPSPETCHHAVTLTLGLVWALLGLTGWSVKVLARWFGALGMSVICQSRAGEVVKSEDPYRVLCGSHPRMHPPPQQA